jgi:hypothetical protein
MGLKKLPTFPVKSGQPASYQTTRSHNPEDQNGRHRRENLKSQKSIDHT